jgi:hypothetical protein
MQQYKPSNLNLHAETLWGQIICSGGHLFGSTSAADAEHTIVVG